MSKKTIRSLEKLNKLKHFQLDEKRQALLEMQAQLLSLNEEVKRIHQLQRDEIETAREESGFRINLPLYLQELRKSQEKIKKEIYRLADFMVPVEASVRDAFKEVKSLEMTIKSLQDEMHSKKMKKEQNEVDELFQNKKRKLEK